MTWFLSHVRHASRFSQILPKLRFGRLAVFAVWRAATPSHGRDSGEMFAAEFQASQAVLGSTANTHYLANCALLLPVQRPTHHKSHAGSRQPRCSQSLPIARARARLSIGMRWSTTTAELHHLRAIACPSIDLYAHGCIEPIRSTARFAAPRSDWQPPAFQPLSQFSAEDANCAPHPAIVD